MINYNAPILTYLNNEMLSLSINLFLALNLIFIVVFKGCYIFT